MPSSLVLVPSCKAGGELSEKVFEFSLGMGKRKMVPFLSNSKIGEPYWYHF